MTSQPLCRPAAVRQRLERQLRRPLWQHDGENSGAAGEQRRHPGARDGQLQHFVDQRGAGRDFQHRRQSGRVRGVSTSNFSYHAYPASGAAIIAGSQSGSGSGGSGGLALMATHSAGIIKFITGGDATGNEALRIDAAKNLIFNNRSDQRAQRDRWRAANTRSPFTTMAPRRFCACATTTGAPERSAKPRPQLNSTLSRQSYGKQPSPETKLPHENHPPKCPHAARGVCSRSKNGLDKCGRESKTRRSSSKSRSQFSGQTRG